MLLFSPIFTQLVGMQCVVISILSLPSPRRYVRLLGAFYLRLTGRPLEVYQYLEPLYNDYRKVGSRLPHCSNNKILRIQLVVQRTGNAGLQLPACCCCLLVVMLAAAACHDAVSNRAWLALSYLIIQPSPGFT